MSELLQQADAHRRNGEYVLAHALYEQIVGQEPSNAAAWWGLAHTVMNEGDFEAAKEDFDQAVRLAPHNQQFLYDYAMLQTMLGEYEQARPLLERIVAIDPTVREALEAKKQLSYY